MTKFKKGYCVASFVFATLVIIFALFVSMPETVSATAAQSNPNHTATSDINNGFSVTYNNEDGTLGFACTYRNFACAVHFDYAYLVYPHYYSVTFCADGDGNADGSSESGDDWACIVFDVLYYGAGVFRN